VVAELGVVWALVVLQPVVAEPEALVACPFFPMARTIAIVHIITVTRTVRLNKLLTTVTAKVLFSKGELSLMAIV
jgi:hypothetical protein